LSSTPNSADLGSEPSHAARGRLQLFLGYAAGVGKTYRMLEEAQHLKRQGRDVVIGYFESHGRKDTIARIAGLETVPTKTINYRGVMLQEMDTEAILKRHPAICVVDELAHTNVPGSGRSKRWEDVQVLLDAGIDVVTNMNIQHLESLNDHVFHITGGVRVRETVPDWLVKSAAEVIMVDVTTEALLNRLKRGVIYAPEKAERALTNFFKESTLVSLRELALREAAHELEIRGTSETAEERAGSPPAPFLQEKGVRDRILIYVTADRSTAMLIRRGRRMADYLGADCFAVAVSPHRRDHRADERIHAVETHLNFAQNLHIEARLLEGDDPAEMLVDFARRNQISQVLVGRPKHRSWNRLLGTDLILRIVRRAKDIRVIIVAERRRQPAPSR
jgi:two-component system, OmpR family, sensor histidine kinase KdpD